MVDKQYEGATWTCCQTFWYEISIIWLEYRYKGQGGVLINIRPSAAIRQNYNKIADICREAEEPVFLTKNSEGDLVVMDIETYNRREKMLKLQDETVYVDYVLDCRKDYSWLIHWQKVFGE